LNIRCIYSLADCVSVENPLAAQSSIPFGIASIVTELENAGHNVRLLVLTPHSPLEKWLRLELSSFSPGLVCFTAVSAQFPFILKIISLVKWMRPQIFALLGGHHASLNPDEMMANPLLDALCIGEGEAASISTGTF
jgi:anaerobic magnesium-protoporphyrin IX monomethyl ester cyclase